MDRLTMTSDKGGVALTFDLDITCKPSEAKKILRLAERVKAYEDTGLTPEEVAALAQDHQAVRLVVPCKIGDSVRAKVHRPYNEHDATIYGTVTDVQVVVRVSHSECRHVDFLASDFGKTVFLVREAVADALGAKENRPG